MNAGKTALVSSKRLEINKKSYHFRHGRLSWKLAYCPYCDKEMGSFIYVIYDIIIIIIIKGNKYIKGKNYFPSVLL